jgi:hypothetical protein
MTIYPFNQGQPIFSFNDFVILTQAKHPFLSTKDCLSFFIKDFLSF